MSDIAELAAAWPDMPDPEGGIDRFAQYPVTGEPVDAPAPGIAGLVDDYADVMLRFAGALESGVIEA